MQIYLDHIRLFSRNAWLFTLARFIFAIGIAITRVFLNLYLLAIGFDAVFLGFVSSVTLIGGAVFTVPAMILLDRLGRQRTMLIGASISVASWLISLLVPTREALVSFQFLAGLGDVMYGMAVVPMLAEISGQRERTTLFSVNEGLTLIGVFVGSLASGFVAALVNQTLALQLGSPASYQAVLLLSIGIRLIGLLPLSLIDHRVNVAADHHATTATPQTSAKPSTLRYLDPRVLLKLQSPIFKLVIPWAMVYFAGSLIFPFLNVFLKTRFGVTDTILGATLGFINLSDGLATLLGPAAVRLLGRRWVVVLGALFSAACLSFIGFNYQFGLVAAVVIVRAGLFNMILPIYRAFVIDLSLIHI
ncbi:MAG: MFS transporter, partial [Anaerolineae bacterium]|nr:MFS transporter [Anaerolineae bacterium]